MSAKSPCASCPFLETNFKEFNQVAEALCELHQKPKPDFWACLSIRQNVIRDGLESGHLLCHSSVYDSAMKAHPEQGRPCAGLARRLAGEREKAVK